MPELKKIDQKLIQMISNGVSAKEMAEKLDKALSFIYYRIDRLKNMDIVESGGYRINYDNLGYNIEAVIVFKIEGIASSVLGYRSPIEALLAEQGEGMVIRYIGSADNRTIIAVRALFKGISEIDSFVKTAQTLFRVKSSDRYLISEKTVT